MENKYHGPMVTYSDGEADKVWIRFNLSATEKAVMEALKAGKPLPSCTYLELLRATTAVQFGYTIN